MKSVCYKGRGGNKMFVKKEKIDVAAVHLRKGSESEGIQSTETSRAPPYQEER
jgi:hypothetical protein